MIPTSMPIALRLGGSRVAARLDKARNLAETAMTRGFIPNQDFLQFKGEIARALEEAHDGWQKNYLQSRDKGFVPGGQEIYYLQPTINNVPGYIAKAQKFAMQGGGTLMDEALALFKEFAPWHAIYNDLKAKVAKRGDARIAPSVPKQVNPDQIRATCSCCFRTIAVAGGGRRMAHHGYTRPELGWQTASCMGVAYPPFEKSADGTKAYRQVLLNHAAQYRRNAAEIRQGNKPIAEQRSYAGRGTTTMVNPDDPRYPQVQRWQASVQESNAAANEKAAEELAKKIASWNPVTIAGL